ISDHQVIVIEIAAEGARRAREVLVPVLEVERQGLRPRIVHRHGVGALKQAIRENKRRSWIERCNTVDGDPWDRPYRTLDDDALCLACQHAQEDVEHVFFHCTHFKGEQGTLQRHLR
ncbi:hypothetical protein CBL_20192, partial [Carabus blaptoides fortunei]